MSPADYTLLGFEALRDGDVVLAIGARLRAERIRNGLSQAELAQKAAIALRTYQRLERDGAGTIETLVAVLRACNRLRALQIALPQPEIAERRTPLSRYTPPRVRRNGRAD
jgi:transcriptional regulator with XRE-family HTH domain